MTSTDSGIWSENGNGTKVYQTVDINQNGVEVKGHYRENSFGGSSGYGSVSSHNGGARPKLVTVTDIPKVGVVSVVESSVVSGIEQFWGQFWLWVSEQSQWRC